MSKLPRFTVYHVKSTMEKKSFYLEHHARSLTEKLNAGNEYEMYAYAPVEHYRTQVVYMVTRKNLMSGLEYQEPSNTPAFMSPACESYWSM